MTSIVLKRAQELLKARKSNANTKPKSVDSNQTKPLDVGSNVKQIESNDPDDLELQEYLASLDNKTSKPIRKSSNTYLKQNTEAVSPVVSPTPKNEIQPPSVKTRADSTPSASMYSKYSEETTSSIVSDLDAYLGKTQTPQRKSILEANKQNNQDDFKRSSIKSSGKPKSVMLHEEFGKVLSMNDLEDEIEEYIQQESAKTSIVEYQSPFKNENVLGMQNITQVTLPNNSTEAEIPRKSDQHFSTSQLPGNSIINHDFGNSTDGLSEEIIEEIEVSDLQSNGKSMGSKQEEKDERLSLKAGLDQNCQMKDHIEAKSHVTNEYGREFLGQLPRFTYIHPQFQSMHQPLYAGSQYIPQHTKPSNESPETKSGTREAPMPFLSLPLEQQLLATTSLVPNLALMDSFVTNHLQLLQDFVRINAEMRDCVQEIWCTPITADSTREYIAQNRPKVEAFEYYLDQVKSAQNHD